MGRLEILEISTEIFFQAVLEKLNFDFTDGNEEINITMRDAIIAPTDRIQFLVAGPGSGKTSTMILRALYLILKEKVDPQKIIMTTFTRKAAEELRSRIQGWGMDLEKWFEESCSIALSKDFNSVEIGTLDSLLKNWLTQAQASRGLTGSVVDRYGMKLLMTRVYLRRDYNIRQEIADYLLYLTSRDVDSIPKSTRFNNSIGHQIQKLLTLSNRLIDDFIDIDEFEPEVIDYYNAHNLTLSVIFEYWLELRNRGLFTFSTLALYFANLLNIESIPNSLIVNVFTEADLETNINVSSILANFQYLFVDEYQDTNFLQEQIYFNLFDTIRQINENATLTVVGDDDQSLYRFRGSTVELFTDFTQRICSQLNINETNIDTRYLIHNYRSTNNIVDFVNRFISLFDQYQQLRVSDKPTIISSANRPYNPPIILIAGDSKRDIARIIADFADTTLTSGIVLDLPNDPYQIDQNYGLGNIVLLANSAAEERGEKRLLPSYLREELQQRDHMLFNPQGVSLNQIASVRQLLGLLLEILNPRLEDYHLPTDILTVLNEWRVESNNYLNTLEDPYIQQYINAMQNHCKIDGSPWNYGIYSIANILYDILVWFPYITTDKEGIVYLSAITSMINQMSIVSFNGDKLFWNASDPLQWERSARSIVWNLLVPIASGSIDIDEELLDTVRQDRLTVRTIHQSKGLEFPVVIVDVGSEIRINHHAWRPRYYPMGGSAEIWLSEKLRPFSPLQLENSDPIQRAFADVIRKFYVAYSRAESLLILAGTHKVFGQILTQDPKNPVKTVQNGWYLDTEQNDSIDNRTELFQENTFLRIDENAFD